MPRTVTRSYSGLVISSAFARRARREVGCSKYDNIPVSVVTGNSPPTIQGSEWHYRTRTGKRIYHPSAYMKCGWSSMVYVSSARRVVVGANWVPNTYPYALTDTRPYVYAP